MNTVESEREEPSSPSVSQQAAPAPTERAASPSKTPTKLTAQDLAERDLQAVAYSKTLLQEGDTMVLIKYPDNCEVYDATGLRMSCQKFRVHSERLLATGSTKFAKLFSEWEQSKFVRRNGFTKSLPPGIKYVLDLTPPNEGDEAVDLISQLSCSTGVRYWCTVERRLQVPTEIWGGDNEVTKGVQKTPETPKKKYPDLVDNLGERDSPSPSHRSPKRNLKAVEEADLQEALKRSRVDFLNQGASGPKGDGNYMDIDKVPEYCPVRHRVGIERLLQLIEGKEPRFDSAPKVWTLFVLSKYFDCTNVVVDLIVSWVVSNPNCQIIEILPEIILKIGMGLETPLLTRPAFAILVSEYALSSVSRECGDLHAMNASTNQFGRLREDVDEDALNGIQAAAYSLVARVEKSLRTFCSASMAWFAEMPEYGKLATLGRWVTDSALNEHEKRSIQESITNLQLSLSHHVRGNMLWAINCQLSPDENSEAINHRRAESYVKSYNSDFGFDVYLPMAEKEKLLTVFPYKILHFISCGLLSDNAAGVSDSEHERLQQIAANHGVNRVLMKDLIKMVSKFNQTVLMVIQNHQFNSGFIPLECFSRSMAWRDNVDNYADDEDDAMDGTKSREGDDWHLPSTKYSGESSRNAATSTRTSRKYKDLTEWRNIAKGSEKVDNLSQGTYRSSLLPTDPVAPHRLRDIEEVPQRPHPHGSAVPRVDVATPLDDLRKVVTPALDAFDPVNPHIPEENKIQGSSPFFSLHLFAEQAQTHIRRFANGMLYKGPDLDFTKVTDTLLCLGEEEWKYLPLWAGGSNDGSGGVFAPMVPPALAGAGPSGPGPAFHTGYSTNSRASSEFDFGGSTTIDGHTSLAVDDGNTDHLNRHRVISENEFQSETFTDDNEQYATTETPADNECSTTPQLEDQQEIEWDSEGKDEPFDYGAEPEYGDGDNDERVFL